MINAVNKLDRNLRMQSQNVQLLMTQKQLLGSADCIANEDARGLWASCFSTVVSAPWIEFTQALKHRHGKLTDANLRDIKPYFCLQMQDKITVFELHNFSSRNQRSCKKLDDIIIGVLDLPLFTGDAPSDTEFEARLQDPSFVTQLREETMAQVYGQLGTGGFQDSKHNLTLLASHAAKFNTVNIMMAGHSGAGKSQLVSALTGYHVETHVTDACTMKKQDYTTRGKLKFWDTKGFEKWDEAEFADFEKNLLAATVDERPHVVLMPYRFGNRLLSDGHGEHYYLRVLNTAISRAKIPVIWVFTDMFSVGDEDRDEVVRTVKQKVGEFNRGVGEMWIKQGNIQFAQVNSKVYTMFRQQIPITGIGELVQMMLAKMDPFLGSLVLQNVARENIEEEGWATRASATLNEGWYDMLNNIGLHGQAARMMDRMIGPAARNIRDIFRCGVPFAPECITGASRQPTELLCRGESALCIATREGDGRNEITNHFKHDPVTHPVCRAFSDCHIPVGPTGLHSFYFEVLIETVQEPFEFEMGICDDRDCDRGEIYYAAANIGRPVPLNVVSFCQYNKRAEEVGKNKLIANAKLSRSQVFTGGAAHEESLASGDHIGLFWKIEDHELYFIKNNRIMQTYFTGVRPLADNYWPFVGFSAPPRTKVLVNFGQVAFNYKGLEGMIQKAPVHASFNESSHCEVCNVTFGGFTRRHHCRMCGKSVCRQHNSKETSVELQKLFPGQCPVRICTGKPSSCRQARLCR